MTKRPFLVWLDDLLGWKRSEPISISELQDSQVASNSGCLMAIIWIPVILIAAWHIFFLWATSVERNTDRSGQAVAGMAYSVGAFVVAYGITMICKGRD